MRCARPSKCETVISHFNAVASRQMITLKMGAHAGTCLAVTLNGQLDYFGQTVNIAARIQGMAAPDEVCISDEIYLVPGAAELLAGYDVNAQSMRVKGVDREIVVHRIASNG